MSMKKIVILTIVAGLAILSSQSCKKEPTSDSSVEYDTTPYKLAIGDFEEPSIAPDNELTKQGVLLGRMLFYEKKLSKDGSMSCASCHRQEHAFTDTARLSIGVEKLPGKRQAMAVFNMAWHNNEFFWDGRSHLLRDQSLMPIQDPLEMNETLENNVAKLKAEKQYRDQFMRAFGSEEITSEKMSLALEQFMNSIVSVESKYDRFLRGEATLTASEERGRALFFDEFNPGFPSLSGADCAHCHTTRTFENDLYMNNGLDSDADMKDIGREEVTGSAADRAKFKVTSLRNVEVTAPYMHDGRFKALEEVVEHYNSGIKASSTVDPALDYTRVSGGLQLTAQDKADLVAFLKTLTDEVLLTNPEYSDPF
ncbi:cytochrome-c peroxidase [Owenweeksia hongkongensis]|uniref:cytochrome-c peroxidase n=1 Tax=Owenweeksia hongkongensis TaxID=253245 RepID=UPI003A93BF71